MIASDKASDGMEWLMARDSKAGLDERLAMLPF